MSVTRQSGRRPARPISSGGWPSMPSEVELTRTRAPSRSVSSPPQAAARTRPPKRAASASARSGLRLTTWTGAKPRASSAQTTARARATGAENDGGPGRIAPPRRALVEIGEEADAVGRGRDEASALPPDGVDRPYLPARRLDLVDRGEGDLLVRHRDVAAGIGPGREAAEEGLGRGRLDRLDDIVARDAIGLQPEAVDDRGARVLDRPADDAGDRIAHGARTPSVRSRARSGRSGSPRMVK
jgi:hypothetical protein